MKQYYCTLFDSFYLSRGLAMVQSLAKSSKEFHLYIFPFDPLSLQILESLRLNNVTLVPLGEFENDRLLAIKSSRSRAEYCWTCTPSVIDYCMVRFQLPSCTYMDADLYFFSDPVALLEEMGDSAVLVTDHRYSKRYDQSKSSGIYCVQFIAFKNSEPGKKVLHWWRDRCIEWCFDRIEDGKFGDQKYLDDWTTRFEGVHVLTHLGAGLAPWNVQQFPVQKKENRFLVTHSENSQANPLVFYHFHAIKFLPDGDVDLGAYDLRFEYILELYQTYLREIVSVDMQLQSQFAFTQKIQPYLTKRRALTFVHKTTRWILGVYNVYSLSNFVRYGATH